MMIVMKAGATEDEIQSVIERGDRGARPHLFRGEERTVIGAIGDASTCRARPRGHPGVEQVVPILKPYKLASAQFRPDAERLRDRRQRVGGDHFAMIAGPCSVESRDHARPRRGEGRRRAAAPRRGVQAPHVAVRVPGTGAPGAGAAGRGQGGDRAARRTGAAWTSGRWRRSSRSPTSSRSARATCRTTRCSPRSAAPASRCCSSAALSATVEELVLAAEYILKEGNEGDPLRARHPHVRDRLPLHARPLRRPGAQGADAPPRVRRPQPCRGTARAGEPLSLAAAAVGADGLIVEVHPSPEDAICDGPQALHVDDFAGYVEQVERAAAVAGKVLSSVRA